MDDEALRELLDRTDDDEYVPLEDYEGAPSTHVLDLPTMGRIELSRLIAKHDRESDNHEKIYEDLADE